jgi:D-alanine-D-alanine ligase
MQGTVVGVLRGGPSREHEVSLRTGHAFLSNLSPGRFTPRDLYIDRGGVWYERGRPVDPTRVLHSIDVALLGLHGEYGEDGEVQRLLERAGVPYAGSDSFGSFLAMHKVLAKEKAKEIGLMTPEYRLLELGGDLDTFTHDVVRAFHQPVIVKPVRSGSSVGVSIVGGYAPVYRTIEHLRTHGLGGVLIEELIRGREATVGVVEDLRGEALYALPTVEIIPPERAGFFSAEVKYTGETQEICPGNFSRVITEDLQNAAKRMHKALGLRHYSRSDFMVTPKGIYYLETNTLPGMTEESLFPKSLQAIGVSLSDFLVHLVNLALKR